MIHELKTWPEPFAAVLRGDKTHEVRKADRTFSAGDQLLLREFVPCESCNATGFVNYVECRNCGPVLHGHCTGRELLVEVTYVTNPLAFGLPSDVAVMSIRLPYCFYYQEGAQSDIRTQEKPPPPAWGGPVGRSS